MKLFFKEKRRSETGFNRWAVPSGFTQGLPKQNKKKAIGASAAENSPEIPANEQQ